MIAHMISPYLEKNMSTGRLLASTTLQKPILKEIRLRPKTLDLSGASLKVSFYYSVSKALIFATSDPIWAKEAKNRPNHFWQPFGEALVGLIKRNGLDG